MKLNIGERLTLMGVLPEKGNFETMDTVSKLNAALVLSEEEVEKWKFNHGEKRITWSLDGNEPVEIDISAIGEAFLIGQLQELDKKDGLTIQQFRLLKTFRGLD